MADQMNPHHLIALLNYAIGLEPDHAPRRLKIPSYNVIGGVINHPDVDRRTFPVLDAIASLCISEPQHQVVAVGFQFMQVHQQLRLIISENGRKGPGLVSYLTRVWNILRGLSDEFAAYRSRNSLDQEPPDLSLPSQPIPEDIGEVLQIDLFREIYLHTVQKNRKRVAKWWPKLEYFMNQLYQARPFDLVDSERDLETAYKSLKYGYNILDRPRLDLMQNKSWIRADSLLVLACHKIRNLTQAENKFCESLVKEIDGPNPNPFNLRRSLLKLSSEYRHIQTLIEFANSTRLRQAFVCQMSITIVPTTAEQVVHLPSSESEWEEIIRKVNSEPRYNDATWPKMEALRLRLFFQKTRWTPDLHCECALIAYLGQKSHLTNDWGFSREDEAASGGVVAGAKVAQIGRTRYRAHGSWAWTSLPKDRKSPYSGWQERKQYSNHNSGSSNTDFDWTDTPAFSYIGVSKLSCRACQLWIKCRNQLSGSKFYTRGCHGKWYWPWGLPISRSQELSADLVEEMSWQYNEYCRTKDILASSTDSTDADMGRANNFRPSRKERLAESYLVARRRFDYWY